MGLDSTMWTIRVGGVCIVYLVCRVVGSGASILLLSSMGSIIYGFFGRRVYVIYILGDGGFVEGFPSSLSFYPLVVELGG